MLAEWTSDAFRIRLFRLARQGRNRREVAVELNCSEKQVLAATSAMGMTVNGDVSKTRRFLRRLKLRRCLVCLRLFASPGPGIRICPACKGDDETGINGMGH